MKLEQSAARRTEVGPVQTITVGPVQRITPRRVNVESRGAGGRQAGPVVKGHAWVLAAANGVRDALEHKPALSRPGSRRASFTPFSSHVRTVDRRFRAREHRAMAAVGSLSPTVQVLVVDDQLAFHDAARELIDATVAFSMGWRGELWRGRRRADRASSPRSGVDGRSHARHRRG